ncbi:hypothetical protein [Agromyces sp. SYSU T00266]|uniref:hypothetical protein n=1 Tax=Agromyces zhanjiangensis TaxID=3158562 RepID=UPI003394487C
MSIRMRGAVGLIAAAVLMTGVIMGAALPAQAGSGDSGASASADPAAPDDQSRSESDADAQAAAAAAAAASVGAGSEAVFVPVTPCRIIDTRAGGGKLAANSTRTFYVAGTTGFAPQGGTSGGCGVPGSATAVSISLTTTQASGKGRLTAFPAGVSAPNSTLLSYTSSANVSSSSSVALTTGAGKDMAIRNFNASTHLVADVLGYWAPQSHAYVSSTGDLLIGSRVVSSTKVGTGHYVVTFDTDVTTCSSVGGSDYASRMVSSYHFGGDTIDVFVYDQNGAQVDYWFYLLVMC